MQQDNKYSYINNSNSQMMTHTDNYRKILAHCENFLNSYIKFMVPPQPSTCQQLKRLLQLNDEEAQWPSYTDLQFVEEAKTGGGRSPKDDATPKSPFTPSKICRFAEVAEIAPCEDVDEVDSVIFIPEPFKMHNISQKASKFNFGPLHQVPTPEHESVVFLPEPTEQPTTEKTESFEEKFKTPRTYSVSSQKAFKFGSASPKVLTPLEQKSVIFLPEPPPTEIENKFPSITSKVVEKFRHSPLLIRSKFISDPVDDKFTPTKAKSSEKLTPTTPGLRPKYTTQVSTVSQRSNTVSLYSCWPPPVGIILISVLEVILFVVNENTHSSTSSVHGKIADVLMFNPYRRIEVWRFITYLFVHIGLAHLSVNLGVQVFLGVILEMVHDRWRVLTIYFAGILAGSLGTSVFSPRVKLAGASGGVYSLITAHVVTVILNWKNMQYPVTQLFVFLTIIGLDLSSAISSSSLAKVEDISYIAHGCGTLSGLLVGFPVLRNLSSDKKARWFQYIGLVIYLSLILAAVIWNIVATEFFPKQEI